MTETTDPYLVLFEHPDLTRPKKPLHGIVTAGSGRKVKWQWEDGAVRLSASDAAPDPAGQNQDWEDAVSKLPAFVNKLQDDFWDKYRELAYAAGL